MTKPTFTKNVFNKTISNAKFKPYTIWTKKGNIATPPRDFYLNVRKDDIGTLAEAANAEAIHVDLKNGCHLPCNKGLDDTYVCVTTEMLVRFGVISAKGEKSIQSDFGIDMITMKRDWLETKKGKFCLNDLEECVTFQTKYQPTCPSYGTANVETHKIVDGVRYETGINKSIAQWHVWAINGHCNILMDTKELKELTLCPSRNWYERMTTASKKADQRKSTFTRRVDLLAMLDLPSTATMEMLPEFAEYFNKAHSTNESTSCASVASKYYTQPWDETALRAFLTDGMDGIDKLNEGIKLKRDQVKVFGNGTFQN